MFRCVFLLFVGLIGATNASCIWYGVCYNETASDHIKVPKPCPYFGEPRPLNDETAVNYLNEYCRAVFPNRQGNLLYY